MLKKMFANWNFDVKSSIMTMVILPIGYYILLTMRKYLQNWCKYLLEGLMYNATRLLKHSLAKGLTFRRYCSLKLGDNFRYLYVPSSLDIKLDVDTVYVPLTLGQSAGGQIYNHDNLLSLGNRIRVIGDPGSGKSSLVKKIYRDLLHKGQKKPSLVRLPVIIELKNLDPPKKVKDLGEWLYSTMRREAEKSNVYKMAECFDSYAMNQGLLVMLDGLDEVSTVKFNLVQKTINSLSVKLEQMSENNCLIVTMRTQFHQQIKDQFRDSLGAAVFVNPFTPTDIYTFLTKWSFINNHEQQIARIYKELTDRPTLREMCSNPLILSMYIADDQAIGTVAAPESRTDFYRKVCEELIIKRRMQQTGTPLAYTKLREQRERILGRLAYEHMLNSKEAANTILLSDAHRIAKEIAKCNDEDAVVIIKEIAKETGLISEEKLGQTVRFIHLTFCEFLCAFEAVDGQKDGWSRLISSHSKFMKLNEPQNKSRLVEVIPFASGLLPRVLRSDAISDVAILEDYDLLSRCFLETKLYDHQCWRNFVERQKQRILAIPEKEWDEVWLRNLHLFNVVIADCNHCSIHAPAVESIDLQLFFSSLLSAQQQSLIEIISIYAKKDAAAAFRLVEISNLDMPTQLQDVIVNNCDQAPFYALVKQEAIKDIIRIGKWASLLTEAGLRSIVVAEWMSNDKPSNELFPHIHKCEPGNIWYTKTKGFNNFFTQCLTLAINDPDNTLPLTSIVKKIPPPTRFVIYWSIIGWVYTFLFYTIFSYGIELVFYLIKHQHAKANPMSNLFFWVIYTFILSAFYSRTTTLNTYRRIMRFPEWLHEILGFDAKKTILLQPAKLRSLNLSLARSILQVANDLNQILKAQKGSNETVSDSTPN